MVQATDSDTTHRRQRAPVPWYGARNRRRAPDARPKDPTSATRLEADIARSAKRDADGADRQSNSDDKDAPSGRALSGPSSEWACEIGKLSAVAWLGHQAVQHRVGCGQRSRSPTYTNPARA